MQFKEGADVLAADGEKVGSVDRVVIDPNTKQVTHLIIQKGFLFTTEKVIPIDRVGPATDDEVTLWDEAKDLDDLPDFEERNYVAADEEAGPEYAATAGPRPLYGYPPFVTVQSANTRAGLNAGQIEPQYVERVEQNIPAGHIALEVGATVMSADEENLGTVEQIFVSSNSEEATHLLVSDGVLAKTRKLIPIGWIHRVFEDEIYLSVFANLIHTLPEYEEQS